MPEGVPPDISVTAPGRLAWIFGSSRSGSTWLLRMLAELERVVPIDDPHIGHHLGVWRPIPLAWATAKDPPKLGTLADFKRQKRDYLFSDRYRDVWMPQLRRADQHPLRGAGGAGHRRGRRHRRAGGRRQGAGVPRGGHDHGPLPRVLADLPAPGRPRRRRFLARCLQGRQLGDRRGRLSPGRHRQAGADPLAVERLAPPHRGGPGDLRAHRPEAAGADPLRGDARRSGRCPGADLRDARHRGEPRAAGEGRRRQLLLTRPEVGQGSRPRDPPSRARRLGRLT